MRRTPALTLAIALSLCGYGCAGTTGGHDEEGHDHAHTHVPRRVVPEGAGAPLFNDLGDYHRAITTDAPLRVHGALWGKATQEVVLGIIESSEQRREVFLEHQVPYAGTEVE